MRSGSPAVLPQWQRELPENRSASEVGIDPAITSQEQCCSPPLGRQLGSCPRLSSAKADGGAGAGKGQG